MKVVIVGKTKMHGGVCIGAIAIDSLESMRLIPPGQACNPTSTPFAIGDLWDVDIKKRRKSNPPHVEDHDFFKRKKVGSLPELEVWLRTHIKTWTGLPADLFDGAIKFRGSSTAFVAESGPAPNQSTGFWVLPRMLEYCPFVDNQGKVHAKYALAGSAPIVLPYVGFAPPAKFINSGKLVRLSLSRPWKNAPENIKEERERHSVQLSGWF